jgi:hypothetical protein
MNMFCLFLCFTIKVAKFPKLSISARSKASTVFGRSNIGIAGSNPANLVFKIPLSTIHSSEGDLIC